MGPLFVYNEEVINETLFDLLNLPPVDRLFYNVETNPFPRILEQVLRIGASLRCSSLRVCRKFRKLCPGGTQADWLFSPRLAVKEDYEEALRMGAILVLKGPGLLRYPRAFSQNEVLLGLEAEPLSGPLKPESEKRIFTPLGELLEMGDCLGEAGARVAGFYLESRKTLPASIETVIEVTHRLSPHFPHADILCLADGIASCHTEGQRGVDLVKTGEALERLSEQVPDFRLWISPGPSLLTRAGVLVMRVLDVFREKGGVQTLIIEGRDRIPAWGLVFKGPQELVNLSAGIGNRNLAPWVVRAEKKYDLSLFPGQESAVVEKGDILLVTGAGARLDGAATDNISGGQRVSEHYLGARRICQVPL